MNLKREVTFAGLKKSADFKSAYECGRYVVTKEIVVYYKKNDLKVTRVGFSVGKKIGKSVVRSRVKRLMKESFRLNFKAFTDSYDLVFVARKGFNPETYRQVEKTVCYLLRKIK